MLGADTRFPPGSVESLRARRGARRPARSRFAAARRGRRRVRDGSWSGSSIRRAWAALRCAALGGRDAPCTSGSASDERPYELGTAFQAAIDAGEQIAAIEIGPTRDLTTPVDLLEQNFPYLGGL